jgi:ParB family chromosome partitioning protein
MPFYCGKSAAKSKKRIEKGGMGTMFELRRNATKVYQIPLDQIEPSPYQARQTFDEAELYGLAQSIRENGLLQPISVRKRGEGRYELIAGERRLRACRMMQMETIPAIVRDYEDTQTAAMGLLENLQRMDLNPFEQAQGLRDVIALWDCTQAEAAKRLGMAQPTLANKLRLLQLTRDQRQFVLDNHLTERHARAVLRLSENRRSEALIYIAKHHLNARATDHYIEQLLSETQKGKHRISMVKDVRIFMNTIDHAIRVMTDSGIPATTSKEEKDGYIEYTVRIPTAAAKS